jgi:hypothetical protein
MDRAFEFASWWRPLGAVKKDRKRAATHRYISVETLRPTETQLEDHSQKQHRLLRTALIIKAAYIGGSTRG